VVGQAPPQYIDINPENRGYFCNIGHISSRRYQIEREKFIDAPGFPACTANHSRFMFDFLQVFNAQSNYLCPGIKYTLEIGVYSENSSYKMHSLIFYGLAIGRIDRKICLSRILLIFN